MVDGNLGFYKITDNIVINKEQALQLYQVLNHQYISHDDYPEVHKLLKEIRSKFEIKE